MPRTGYDWVDTDPRLESQKYYEQYEDEIKMVREIKNFVEGYEDSMDSQDFKKIMSAWDPQKEISTLLKDYKKWRSDLNAKNEVVLMDYVAEQYNILLDIIDPKKYVVRKPISKSTNKWVNF